MSPLSDGKGHRVRHGGHHAFISTDSADHHNCTVAFMSDCTSLDTCSKSCASMGAASYRWFNEHGCCECIGSSCLDYGMGEPRCLRCPTERDELRHDSPQDHLYNYAREVNEKSFTHDDEEEEDAEEDDDWDVDDEEDFEDLLQDRTLHSNVDPSMEDHGL